MSSSIKKQIEEINNQIYHGNFQEALGIIDKNLKVKELLKEDELNLLNLKCEIYGYLGEVEKALQIVKKVLKESKGLENVLIYVKALMNEIQIYYFQGKWKDLISPCDEGLMLIKDYNKQTKQDVTKEKSFLMMYKGSSMFQLGDYENFKELVLESVRIGKESSDPLTKFRSEYYGVTFSLFFGEIKGGADFFEEIIAKAENIGNKFELALIHGFTAAISNANKEYTKAIESFQKAIELLKELNNKNMECMTYHDLGLNYRRLMKLDEAIECFTKTLELDRIQYAGYANLGICYFWKYDLDKAEEAYMKAYESSKEEDDRSFLPYILSNLIELYIEKGKLDQAQRYLEELNQHKKETGYQRDEHRYLFASALLLKASSSMSDWIKGIETFEELIKAKDLSEETKIKAQFHILTIRLRELQSTADDKVLQEVYEQIDNLQAEAESKKYYMFQIEIYQLKSQLALLELDIKKATNLLIAAHTLADDKGLTLIAQRVINDQEKLEKQTAMWNQFREEKAPLSETLKQISLTDSAKKIAKETLMEVRDEESGKIIEYRKLFALKI